MLPALILGFLLIVSCVAPISYQVIRYIRPRWPIMWRLFASFVVMVLSGFVAFYWVIPAIFPINDVSTMQFGTEPRGSMARKILFYTLVILALISTGLTIAQLFRRGLSASALAWRVPVALGLAAYCLVLAMLIVAGVW